MSELPARVQSKLMALADAEQQALTTTTMNQRQISETQRMLDNNPHGDKAAALGREIARLQGLQPDYQARHRALADLNAKVRRFLDMLPAGVALDNAKPVKVKLKPGESRQQAVANVRLDVLKLIGERGQVERAALPIDEMKAQAKKWITERALNGRPAITATHDKFSIVFSYMDPNAYTPSLDPLALLAWFDPEHLEAKLFELIDEMPKPKLALTPKDRSKRLAEIKDELFECEKIEQAHLEAALAEGTLIEQRPNVDIRALLGLVVVRDNANAA